MNKLTKIAVIIIAVIAIGGAVIYFKNEAQHRKANAAIMESKKNMQNAENRDDQRKKIATAYLDTSKQYDEKVLMQIYKDRGLAN